MQKKLFYVVCICITLIGGMILANVSCETFAGKQEKGIIVIDVGHGGLDPGKVSDSGIKEKDINLQIAKYLKDYLIAQDYTVYLDREKDCDLSDKNASNKKTSDMRNRVDFFSDKKAKYVISIHQNSFPDGTSHGAQVFYYRGSDTGKEMAVAIQKELLAFDTTNKRDIKENVDYYILKKSKVPTVIVECGFLSNKEEVANLTDSEYQKQLAYAICKGVCKFDK